MEEKLDLIAEINKFHPGYGTDKGYSKYIGGMTDTGEWLYNVMIKESVENLKAFLDELIENQKKAEEWGEARLKELEEVKTWPKEKQDEFFKNENEEFKKSYKEWIQGMESFLMWGDLSKKKRWINISHLI